MKSTIHRTTVAILCALLFSLAFAATIGAQPSTPGDRSQKAIQTLKEINQSIALLQSELKQKEAEYRRAETDDRKEKLAKEIREINARLDANLREFESIASGMDVADFSGETDRIFNFKEEIQEIIRPLVEELKNVTRRPREIERLRKEIDFYEKSLPAVQAAIANIQSVREAADETAGERALTAHLAEIEEEWQNREKEIIRQISRLQYQLDQKMESRQSLFRALQSGAREFFQTRGLNLLLALVTFFAIFLLLRFLYWRVYRISYRKRPETRSLYNRLFQTAYQFFTFMVAIGAALFLLYAFGDWMLLSIALILLVGVAWTARHAFSIFWEQSKLLLNIGTVREKERIIYNGIPWQVDALNIQTNLINPELKGGLIRLPLKSLIGLQSRPCAPEELWFPTREGDYVLLGDGTYGRVLMQTPEMVTMDVVGGCRKTYPTTSFMDQNPVNLSINNFGVSTVFGIDYAHQAEITDAVPEKLKAVIEEGLAEEAYGEHLVSLLVQFKEAGASSLDILIFAGFAGEAAANYYPIARALQRLTVEACNQYGWGIPFPQITVHGVDGTN